MPENPDNIQALLEQLKQIAHDTRPDEAEPPAELVDRIRAHGAAAIEPLVNMLTQVMEANWAVIDDETAPWNYAHVYIVDLLTSLPLAEPAVSQLFDLMDEYEEDEWFNEEVIHKLPRRGEAVIEPVAAVLRDRSRIEWTRISVADLLGRTAEQHPELRDRIADTLVSIMTAVEPNEETDDDRAVNAFMLIAMEETRAERYIPFIEQMFALGRVDETITGLDYVRMRIQGIEPPEVDLPDLDPESFRENLARFMGIDVDDLPSIDPAEIDSVETPFGQFGREKPVVMPKRPGRNDPCWCGSGKKYKKCHWREDQEKDRKGWLAD